MSAQTDHVQLVLNNTQELYGMILDVYTDACEDYDNDNDRIWHIADQIELEINGYVLTGDESPLGDELLRDYLAAVNWYEIAKDFYVAHGAGEAA